MHNVFVIFKREFAGYFSTPVAYVFIVIFLALLNTLTFTIGGFFERGQANLVSFFSFQLWLYLPFLPALTMRLWAEERKSGTIELLLTLPITPAEAVIGKFLAAWAFTVTTLALTFPMWITVNYLGDPDNGVIVASYAGSALIAGVFLALGSCLSALTRNQVIAFVIGVAAAFALAASGSPVVVSFLSDWAPAAAIDILRFFSVIERFNSITRGVIDPRDFVYFGSMILFWLFATTVAVQARRNG